jgi:hypothetical protein
MKRTTQYAGSFIAAALAGTVLSASSDAAAWFVRSHTSACIALGGAPYDTGFSIQNDSAVSNMKLLCPATDTSSTPKATTSILNIHGYDDSSAANVKTAACRSTWAAPGGACQDGQSSSGVGNFKLTVPTNVVWTAGTAGDFGYAYINLPPKEGAAHRSNVRGIYQAGP